MELNSVVYPAPEPTSDVNFFLQSEDEELRNMLLMVDQKDKSGNVEYQIPAIFLDNRAPDEEVFSKELILQQQQLMKQLMKNGDGDAGGDAEDEKEPDDKELQQIQDDLMKEMPELEETKNKGERCIIYFHGNAEDLFLNLYFLHNIKDYFNYSVLGMEYPGYGFFSHQILNNQIQTKKKFTPNAKEIKKSAISLFEHVIKPKKEGGLGFQREDVILFGRSMGSGPSSMLANMFKPRGLVLMSPYTTVKDVAANMAGKFLSIFIQEHFNNLEMMKRVKCPVLLIHGEADTLIPSKHSHILFETLLNQRDFQEKADETFDHLPYCNVIFHQNMTHNDFHMNNEIMTPMKEFLQSIIPLYEH